jgi:hypothetical protein
LEKAADFCLVIQCKEVCERILKGTGNEVGTYVQIPDEPPEGELIYQWYVRYANRARAAARGKTNRRERRSERNDSLANT